MGTTAFGIIAAIVLLASFVLKGEKKIRIVNLIGCVFLVLFAINLGEDDLIVAKVILILLGVATVLIHGVHFWHSFKQAKAERNLAKAENRAAEAEKKIDEELSIKDTSNNAQEM